MTKKDELTSSKSCFNKSQSNEMLFVLRAHDSIAPKVIEYWAELRISSGKNDPDDPQIVDALQCAAIMRIQQEEGI